MNDIIIIREEQKELGRIYTNKNTREFSIYIQNNFDRTNPPIVSFSPETQTIFLSVYGKYRSSYKHEIVSFFTSSTVRAWCWPFGLHTKRPSCPFAPFQSTSLIPKKSLNFLSKSDVSAISFVYFFSFSPLIFCLTAVFLFLLFLSFSSPFSSIYFLAMV